MDYRSSPELPLILSTGRTIRSLDFATGDVRWANEDFGDAAGGALLVTEERVYVAGWKEVGSIDVATGRTIFHLASECNGRPAILLEGDRLLVAGSGTLECIGIDGSLLWRRRTPRANSTTIALGHRTATDDRE